MASFFSYLLVGYAVGAALVAIRLVWHMVFRLDEFDWEYSRATIWMSFCFFALLWPIALVAPGNLADPEKLFKDSLGLAERARAAERLRKDPPLCGRFVSYRQKFGEFMFLSADIERVLVDAFRKTPHLASRQEGAILDWLEHRDDTIAAPTDVPVIWERFKFIADLLVREGYGEVRCTKCNALFPTDLLLPRDDRGRRSWNSARLACPKNHELLVVERMHVHIPGPRR